MGMIRAALLLMLVGGAAAAQGIVYNSKNAERVKPTTVPTCSSSTKGLRVSSSDNSVQVCNGTSWAPAVSAYDAMTSTTGARFWGSYLVQPGSTGTSTANLVAPTTTGCSVGDLFD